MSNVKKISEENFEAEVLNNSDVVMVEFGASWCRPCKTLEPVLEKVAEETTLKVCKVDIDDCVELTKKYSVRGVPTILIFKEGKIVKQHVGLANKEALLKLASV